VRADNAPGGISSVHGLRALLKEHLDFMNELHAVFLQHHEVRPLAKFHPPLVGSVLQLREIRRFPAPVERGATGRQTSGLLSPYCSGTRIVSPGVWIGRLSSSLWNCEPREYPSPDCWNGPARKSLSWTLGPFSAGVSGPTASRFGIGAVLAVGGLAGGIGGTGSDRFGPAPALASRTRKGHAATMLPLMLMMRRAVALCADQLNQGVGRGSWLMRGLMAGRDQSRAA